MPGTGSSATGRRNRIPPASRATRFMANPGWVVAPLRAFLGTTFVYAGLQKLADRNFFKASAPSSIQSQIKAYSRTSPIGGVLQPLRHEAVLIGLVIALAELAIGLGTLLGLWTRAAAVGGAILSVFFLLTVSWHSRPYYYGADIVFAFAWIPMALAGSGTVWSLDGVVAKRARRELRLPPVGRVDVEFATIRRLCGAYEQGTCRLRRGEPCAPEPCPVLAVGPDLRPAVARELDRREFLGKSRVAALLAANALGLGALVALVGRLIPAHQPSQSVKVLGAGPATTSTTGAPVTDTAPATTPPATAAPAPQTARPSASPTTAAPPPAPAAVPAGTAIGAASAVPVGGAAQFADPSDGSPAYVLRTGQSTFKAFSAVCTHAGCTVDYNQAGKTFDCPCHGAVFSAATGQVVQGPARRALPAIAIAEGPDGQLYAK